MSIAEMHDRRDLSSLLRYSVSAPALCSASPAPVPRVGRAKQPVDSLSLQQSDSSSPTTSLLLQMWGYDQAPPPSRSARAVDLYPDLATDENEAPRCLRVRPSFRMAAGLLCGLAVLACLVAVVLITARQLRTMEWFHGHHTSNNQTEPVQSLVEDHLSAPSRSKNEIAGDAVPTSPPGAVRLYADGNKTRMLLVRQNVHGLYGRPERPVRRPSRERLYRPEALPPLKRRRVLYHSHVPEQYVGFVQHGGSGDYGARRVYHKM